MSRAWPPRLPTSLLRQLLPPGRSGESMLGDLREEWAGRHPGVARDAWYALEAVRLAFRYGGARLGSGLRDGASVAWASRGDAGEDARQALRRLLRSPLQLALTVIALGLGVAAPATMFTIVQGLTRDLDVPEPERLVHIGRRMTGPPSASRRVNGCGRCWREWRGSRRSGSTPPRSST